LGESVKAEQAYRTEIPDAPTPFQREEEFGVDDAEREDSHR